MKSEVFRDDATLSNKNEIIVWLRLTQCQVLFVLFLLIIGCFHWNFFTKE